MFRLLGFITNIFHAPCITQLLKNVPIFFDGSIIHFISRGKKEQFGFDRELRLASFSKFSLLIQSTIIVHLAVAVSTTSQPDDKKQNRDVSISIIPRNKQEGVVIVKSAKKRKKERKREREKTKRTLEIVNCSIDAPCALSNNSQLVILNPTNK